MSKKKKKLDNCHEFTIDLFAWVVVVAVGEDTPFWEAIPEGGVAGCSLMYDNEGNAYSLIILPSDCDISVAAHEAGHSVMFMLEDRGVPMSAANSEVFCYSLQRTMEHLSKIMGWEDE